MNKYPIPDYPSQNKLGSSYTRIEPSSKVVHFGPPLLNAQKNRKARRKVGFFFGHHNP